MNKENYLVSAIFTVNEFINETSKKFDDNYSVFAKMPKTGILSGSVYYSIYKTPFDAKSIDFDNDVLKLKFVMHLSDNFGNLPNEKESFAIELLSMGYRAKDNGLKYRKITSKSPELAVKKLIDWITKNETIIKSVTK